MRRILLADPSPALRDAPDISLRGQNGRKPPNGSVHTLPFSISNGAQSPLRLREVLTRFEERSAVPFDS
jgi:hypothetical protein